MTNYILEQYCLLLNKDVNDEYSAIGILNDLKYYFPKLKEEILSNCTSIKKNEKNNYLDLVIQKVSNGNYQMIDEEDLDKWLNRYEITLYSIMEEYDPLKKIYALLDTNYGFYHPKNEGDIERHEMYEMQKDFANYFCNHFVKQIIPFCQSLKHKKENKEKKGLKDNYFNDFINYISSNRYLYESNFLATYEYELKPTYEKACIEINENLITIPDNKIDNYLSALVSKVNFCNVVSKDASLISRWIEKYNLEIDNFPFINNEELKKKISIPLHRNKLSFGDMFLIEDLQQDFYAYACVIESKKMINFLESKMTNKAKVLESDKQDTSVDKTNQLTINQAIILLDKLGVFSDELIERLPNTKKAKLISQLLGKNEKNVKTAIEKLELRKSELGAGYQKDIDKIQSILDNLV